MSFIRILCKTNKHLRKCVFYSTQEASIYMEINVEKSGNKGDKHTRVSDEHSTLYEQCRTSSRKYSVYLYVCISYKSLR